MRTVKRIFICLLLLIFILGLLPLLDGILFKKNYITLVNDNTHGKAQIQSYSLGWLSSTAKVFIPFANDPRNGVTLDETIYHGPYLINPLTNEREFRQAAIESTVHLDPKTETFLLGGNSDSGVMQITTLVSFSNHFTSQMQTPVFNFKIGTQSKVVIQGTTGTFDSDVENNFIKNSVGDIHIGGMHGEGNGVTLTLSPATLNANISCANPATLCAGTVEASFPLLQMTTAQGSAFKLANVRMKNVSHNANNNFGNELQLSLNSLVTPDYSIGAASLKLSYDHVNAGEIKELFDALQQAQGQYTDVRSSQLAAAASLNAALPKIITPQTTLNESLRISATNGVLTSTGKVFWPAGVAGVATSAVELVMAADAQMNVRASMPLVTDVIKQMDAKQAAEAEAAALAAPTKPVADVQPPLVTIDETQLPGYKQFRAEIDALVTNKVITPQIQIVIYKMSDTHTPVRDFNNAVDAMLKSSQITYPVATNLRNGYQTYFNAEQKTILQAIFQTPALNLRELKAKIQSVAQARVINDDVANQLIALQQQSLAPEIYGVALSRFAAGNVIPEDLAAQLKAQYSVINKDLSLNPETADAGALAAASATPAPLPVGPLQAQFNAFLQQGFIKQDGNDYVAEFKYKNGVMTVNGLPIKGK